jgi:hypothetical protein
LASFIRLAIHVEPIHLQPQSSVEENGQHSATVAWLVPTVILGLVVLVGLFAVYRRRWRFRRSHHNNNMIHNKSSIPMMPVPLTKTVILQDRFTANPDYWPSDPPSENASALQSFVIIQPEWIHLIQEIGEGCFGKVYKGRPRSRPRAMLIPKINTGSFVIRSIEAHPA